MILRAVICMIPVYAVGSLVVVWADLSLPWTIVVFLAESVILLGVALFEVICALGYRDDEYQQLLRVERIARALTDQDIYQPSRKVWERLERRLRQLDTLRDP